MQIAHRPQSGFLKSTHPLLPSRWLITISAIGSIPFCRSSLSMARCREMFPVTVAQVEVLLRIVPRTVLTGVTRGGKPNQVEPPGSNQPGVVADDFVPRLVAELGKFARMTMTIGFPVEALQHDSIVVEAPLGKGGGDHGQQDDDRRQGAEQERSAGFLPRRPPSRPSVVRLRCRVPCTDRIDFRRAIRGGSLPACKFAILNFHGGPSL